MPRKITKFRVGFFDFNPENTKERHHIIFLINQHIYPEREALPDTFKCKLTDRGYICSVLCQNVKNQN